MRFESHPVTPTGVTGSTRWPCVIGLALCTLLTLLLAPWPAAAAPNQDTAAEARDIAKVLKCPVCQNVSVADSPSPLAQEMRQVIQNKLDAGESREQIVPYFVERYGEEILLDPPKHGFSQLLWWGPVVALVVGGTVVASTWRPWLRHGAGPHAPLADLSRDEEQMYLALLEHTETPAEGGRR